MNDQYLQNELKRTLAELHRPAGLDQRTLSYIQAQSEHVNANPNNPSVGRQIKLDWTNDTQRTRKRRKKRFTLRAIAACLAVILVGAGIVGVYQTPVAYADVEASASVSLCMNCFDRVIAAESLDASGQSALNELANKGVNLTGMPYSEALEALTETSEFSQANAPEIQVTVACDNQQRRQNLQQRTDSCLNSRKHTCTEATIQDCKSAHEQGKGMHRYGQDTSVDSTWKGQSQSTQGTSAGKGARNGQSVA